MWLCYAQGSVWAICSILEVAHNLWRCAWLSSELGLYAVAWYRLLLNVTARRCSGRQCADYSLEAATAHASGTLTWWMQADVYKSTAISYTHYVSVHKRVTVLCCMLVRMSREFVTRPAILKICIKKIRGRWCCLTYGVCLSRTSLGWDWEAE